MKPKRYLGYLGALSSVCLAAVLLATPSAAAGTPDRLPVFSLPDLDGKTRSSAEFMGKVMVVDFWATWCATCKETIPKLAELHEKYKGKGLVIIGVSVDKGSAERVRKAAKKLGITYLVLHDKDNTLSKSFGFTGIPSLYVFDRRGAMSKSMPGYDPDQEDQLAVATLDALR